MSVRKTLSAALDARRETINKILERFQPRPFIIRKVEPHQPPSGRMNPARPEILEVISFTEVISVLRVVLFNVLRAGSGEPGKQVVLCNDFPGVELIILINGKFLYFTKEYRIPLQSVQDETTRGWTAELAELHAVTNVAERHAETLIGNERKGSVGQAKIIAVKKMTGLLHQNSAFSDGTDSFWLICCQTDGDPTLKELQDALLDNNKNDAVIPVVNTVEAINAAVEHHITPYEYEPSTEKTLDEIHIEEKGPKDNVWGGLFDVAAWFIFKYKFMKPCLKEFWPKQLEALQDIFD